MATFNPEDFWDALRRLYDRQLKFDEQLAKTDEKIDRLTEQLRDLGAYVAETSQQVRLTTSQLQESDGRLDQVVALVRSHELRLQRLEGGAD